MKKTILAAAALGASLFVMQTASAASLELGTYTLHNHPDGGAADPLYGLRLDGLVDGNGSSIYTFSFDAAGAAMFLDYDGSTIHIYGTAWGGLDIGSTYDSPELWTIDMVYASGVSPVAGDGGGVQDIRVVDQSDLNTGTISSSQGTFVLEGYPGNYGYVLQLGDENGNGHRGFDGLSGWGWLNHAPEGQDPSHHISASDWLFTMEPSPVPVPAAFWLLGSALLGFSVIGRRNS